MACILNKDRVTLAQDALRHLHSQLTDLNLPPLGPKFVSLSGSALADALVAHRLTTKFSEPVVADSERASMSIQNMILNDNTGPTGAFDWMVLEDRTRLNLIRVKHEISALLKEFKLPRIATRFPSGESNRTSKGEISFAAKFSQDQQWTCGAGSMSYASRLCHNTPSLKKMVKDRCKQLYPLGFFNDGVGGFVTFDRMFRSVVDIETASLSTVPKDAEWDRVIGMEPTFSMIAQLQLSKGLRKCLLEKWGYSIENRAELHKMMLRCGREFKTIDLKNASNSNWTTIVEALWPPSIVKHLKAFRSDEYVYKTRNGENFFVPRMLSPMGNGFTFEVMTITLLAMVRCLDPLGSVFGDDIIIRHREDELFDMLSVTGWKINETKTFISGNFRESCGGFWDAHSERYLISFDLWYPVDDIDGIVSANKLFRILEADQISRVLRKVLLNTYVELLKIYNLFATDDIPQVGLISDGVFSPRHADLLVNKQYNEMFQALYQRRPKWRLSCNVKRKHSEIPINEWCNVGGMLLGQAEKPPQRHDRLTYITVIDETSKWSHQEITKLFYQELK